MMPLFGKEVKPYFLIICPPALSNPLLLPVTLIRFLPHYACPAEPSTSLFL